jgi:hypothetical protein
MQTTAQRSSQAAASVIAIIEHRVANYGVWKKAFDAHAGARAEGGIVGAAVSRAVDDPDLVVIYLEGTSLEQLRAFLGSADLKNAMQNAGVQGPPRITLAQSA